MNSANRFIAITHLVKCLENDELSVLLFLLNTKMLLRVTVTSTCQAIVYLLDEMSCAEWTAVNFTISKLLQKRLANQIKNECRQEMTNRPIEVPPVLCTDPLATLEQCLSLPLSALENPADANEVDDHGDSLPDPMITKERLDRELDDYMNGYVGYVTTLTGIKWETGYYIALYESIFGIDSVRCFVWNLDALLTQGLQIGSKILIKRIDSDSDILYIDKVLSKGHKSITLSVCPLAQL